MDGRRATPCALKHPLSAYPAGVFYYYFYYESNALLHLVCVPRSITMQRPTGTKDAGTPADSLSPSLESDRHRIYFGVRW